MFLLESWKYNIVSILDIYSSTSLDYIKKEKYIERERREMGRQPCCDKVGLKKGPWTVEEDKKLINFILTNGQCCWRALPKLSGRFSLLISSLNDIFWDFSCVKVHFLASCVFSLSLRQLTLFWCYFSTPTKLMLF